MNLQVLNKKYIDDINFHRKQCSKNKALLSFKYDELNFKTNVIQIIIILLSTGITLIETMKSYYDLNSNIYNTAIIIFSTMIALIMSIFRFLKFDERRENVKKSIEDHVFIINKFRKTFNQLENTNIKGKNNNDELKNLMNNYDNEIFDNYIAIRENFDTIFSFKETIYYKNKYKKLFLELEKTNDEIELINTYKNKIGAIDYVYPSFLKRIFCCNKKKLKYNVFLDKTEDWKSEKNAMRKEEKKQKKIDFEKGKNYYKIKMNHILKDTPELQNFYMKDIIELSNIIEDLILKATTESLSYKESHYNDLDSDNSNEFIEDNMRNEMFRTEACAPSERPPHPVPYEVENIETTRGQNNHIVHEHKF